MAITEKNIRSLLTRVSNYQDQNGWRHAKNAFSELNSKKDTDSKEINPDTRAKNIILTEMFNALKELNSETRWDMPDTDTDDKKQARRFIRHVLTEFPELAIDLLLYSPQRIIPYATKSIDEDSALNQPFYQLIELEDIIAWLTDPSLQDKIRNLYAEHLKKARSEKSSTPAQSEEKEKPEFLPRPITEKQQKSNQAAIQTLAKLEEYYSNHSKQLVRNRKKDNLLKTRIQLLKQCINRAFIATNPMELEEAILRVLYFNAKLIVAHEIPDGNTEEKTKIQSYDLGKIHRDILGFLLEINMYDSAKIKRIFRFTSREPFILASLANSVNNPTKQNHQKSSKQQNDADLTEDKPDILSEEYELVEKEELAKLDAEDANKLKNQMAINVLKSIKKHHNVIDDDIENSGESILAVRISAINTTLKKLDFNYQKDLLPILYKNLIASINFAVGFGNFHTNILSTFPELALPLLDLIEDKIFELEAIKNPTQKSKALLKILSEITLNTTKKGLSPDAVKLIDKYYIERIQKRQQEVNAEIAGAAQVYHKDDLKRVYVIIEFNNDTFNKEEILQTLKTAETTGNYVVAGTPAKAKEKFTQTSKMHTGSGNYVTAEIILPYSELLRKIHRFESAAIGNHTILEHYSLNPKQQQDSKQVSLSEKPLLLQTIEENRKWYSFVAPHNTNYITLHGIMSLLHRISARMKQTYKPFHYSLFAADISLWHATEHYKHEQTTFVHIRLFGDLKKIADEGDFQQAVIEFTQPQTIEQLRRNTPQEQKESLQTFFHATREVYVVAQFEDKDLPHLDQKEETLNSLKKEKTSLTTSLTSYEEAEKALMKDQNKALLKVKLLVPVRKENMYRSPESAKIAMRSLKEENIADVSIMRQSNQTEAVQPANIKGDEKPSAFNVLGNK